jgi:hypothetical protein
LWRTLSRRDGQWYPRKQTKWITDDLIAEVRRVFEPRYKKSMTDEESIQIAMNLTSFVEVYAKWRCHVEPNNTNQASN